MSRHSIETVWIENNIFKTDLDGHTMTIDLPKEAGGDNSGPGPKKLMLLAATGCTSLDVISILAKMKIEPKSFKVKIDADLAEEHPMQYTKMELVYSFEGNNLPRERVERACQLSFEKYCGVLALYKSAIPVTYRVEINNS